MEEKESDVVIWDDAVMMTLALVSGYILVLGYTVSLTPIQILWLDRVDVTIAIIFLAEFCIKFSLAESKVAFFKSNWWYLFASIPITTPATQALRLLRLLRLVRLLRLNTGVQEMMEYLKRFVARTYLVYVLTIWGIIVFSGSVIFFAFEHDVNPHVQTLFDGFWWAMATVTTVGYGDIYPITTGGRVIGILLMITGIGTSGIFTALVASFLIKDKQER